MGVNLTREDLEDIQKSLVNIYQRSSSIPYFLAGSTFLMSKWNSIKDCLIKYIFYTPGVSEPKCVREDGGNRFCILKTSIGDVKIPCIKAHSFDLEYGFIHSVLEEGEGFYDLDQFNEKYSYIDYDELKRIGLQLLIPISRKSQFKGQKSYFYVMDELDNFLYLYPLVEEEIDYKRIFDIYSESLDEMEISSLTKKDT